MLKSHRWKPCMCVRLCVCVCVCGQKIVILVQCVEFGPKVCRLIVSGLILVGLHWDVHVLGRRVTIWPFILRHVLRAHWSTHPWNNEDIIKTSSSLVHYKSSWKTNNQQPERKKRNEDVVTTEKQNGYRPKQEAWLNGAFFFMYFFFFTWDLFWLV